MDTQFSEVAGEWDFILRSDARAHVLMITFGRVVTDDDFLAGLAAVKDFVHQRGPHQGITDLSQVENFGLTNKMLSQLGSMAPAFPKSVRRIVVARTPATYVGARIVQMLRAGTSAPIEIVETSEDAYAMLGIDGSDLIEVQTGRKSPWTTH